MSVVIVGGNECMVCQYEKICREYGCKAKVLVKEKGNIKKKLGKAVDKKDRRKYNKSRSPVHALVAQLERATAF